jgi:hypothetical protein
MRRIQGLPLFGLIASVVLWTTAGLSGEKEIASLRDMSTQEIKAAGFDLRAPAVLHIKAVGAGGDYGWTYKSDRLSAYGWILNASTREVVWEMTTGNTKKSKDDKTFDGTIELQPGAYEVYFSAATFDYHTMFTHFSYDIDHRKDNLFPNRTERKKNFLNWVTGFWSDDMQKEWQSRSKAWGIQLFIDESVPCSSFAPPMRKPGIVLEATGLGDNMVVRRAFSLSGPVTLAIDALGEGEREGELSDYGWIINMDDRRHVWEMQLRNSLRAGGAKKNLRWKETLTLPEGKYELYFITDDSHSEENWNVAPPSDPLNYGVTISVPDEKERTNFKEIPVTGDQNVIVSLVRPGDNAYLSEGFSLKQETRVRVYAIGERANSRRQMADYGMILDARTRAKVWTMDVDRTYPAGGGSKNRMIDEVITLPRGNYLVVYQTDDSHSYDDWNVDPPFDKEHYGITVMGAAEKWNPAIVGKYAEERDPNIIAQIVRPGDDVDKSEPFTLDRTTRIRIYAIGEGLGREMSDYGWIEDAKSGVVVWEMTYGMTFHAGGARKNRMVNTTILLEKGSYRLRYKSDDSHSFGDWNSDPPDDQQGWGITLFREEIGMPSAPVPPAPNGPPGNREDEDSYDD